MRAPKPLAIVLFLAAILGAGLACSTSYSMAPIQTTPTANEIPGIVTGTQSAFARADAYFRELIRGTLVFTTPRTMQLKKPVTVTVLLNPGQTTPTVEIQTPDGTQVITGQVAMSPRMSADLEATEQGVFDIRPIHPSRIQDVSSLQKTQWRWTVTPLREGSHSLLLKLNYVLENGQENFLESYPAEVEVTVTPFQRLQMSWWWIAAFLVVASLIAFLWYSLRQRKQIEEQRSSEREGASRRKAKTPGLQVEKGGNIFISYRRSDSADIAGRIYDRLISDINEDSVFKDVDSIPLGADFKKYLDVKVSECKALLAIIGGDWLECRDETGQRRLDDPGDFVRIEIESALKRGIPVIPLLVQGAAMPDKADLPPTLQTLVYQNGLSIRPDPDFHNDMDRLIAALEKYTHT